MHIIMDLLNFHDNEDTNLITIKKLEISSNSNSMSSGFLCLREIKKLFRIVEIFFILIFLTWIFTRLPFAVRISGEYFRQLLNFVLSPLFIFLLCNFIVLTLFLKSRNLVPSHDESFQLDFINDSPPPPPVPVEPDIEIVYEDKETIFEVSKLVRRSQSENFSRTEKTGVKESKDVFENKILRRSETEMGRRRLAAEEEEEIDHVEMVDELSNEEFQRAIEDFIAKQIKFRQQEKLAVVVHATTT